MSFLYDIESTPATPAEAHRRQGRPRERARLPDRRRHRADRRDPRGFPSRRRRPRRQGDWSGGDVSDLDGGAVGRPRRGHRRRRRAARRSCPRRRGSSLSPSPARAPTGEVTTYAFLRVPGDDDLELALSPARQSPEVTELESVSFDMADLVAKPRGSRIEVGTDVRASGARADAVCAVESGTVVRYDSGAGAPWVDACQVPVRLAGQDDWTYLSVPILVRALDPQPALKAGSMTVGPGETATFDLRNMTTWQLREDWERHPLRPGLLGFGVRRLARRVRRDGGRRGPRGPGRRGGRDRLGDEPRRRRPGAPHPPRGRRAVDPPAGRIAHPAVLAGGRVLVRRRGDRRRGRGQSAAADPSRGHRRAPGRRVRRRELPGRVRGIRHRHMGGRCARRDLRRDVLGARRPGPAHERGAGRAAPPRPARATRRRLRASSQTAYADGSLTLRVDPGEARQAYPALTGFVIRSNGQVVAECAADGTCPAIAAPNGEPRTYEAVRGQRRRRVARQRADGRLGVRPAAAADDRRRAAGRHRRRGRRRRARRSTASTPRETGSVEITSATGETVRIPPSAARPDEPRGPVVPGRNEHPRRRSPSRRSRASSCPPGSAAARRAAPRRSRRTASAPRWTCRSCLTSRRTATAPRPSPRTRQRRVGRRRVDAALRHRARGRALHDRRRGVRGDLPRPRGRRGVPLHGLRRVLVRRRVVRRVDRRPSRFARMQSGRAPRGWTFAVDARAQCLGHAGRVGHPPEPDVERARAQPEPRRVLRLGAGHDRCSTATPAIRCGTSTSRGGPRRRGLSVAPRAGSAPYQVQARWWVESCVGGSRPRRRGATRRPTPPAARRRSRSANGGLRYYDATGAQLAHTADTWTVPVGAVRVEGIARVGRLDGAGLGPVARERHVHGDVRPEPPRPSPPSPPAP